MDETAEPGPPAEETAAPAPPAGRTIGLGELTPALRSELVSVLGPRGPAILASHDRFASRERLPLGLAAVGLFALAALAATGLGAACSPRAEASWALVYALALVPLALALVRGIGWVMRARAMPFPPGVYVLDRHVVIAHGPALRIVPLAKVAGIGAPRRLPTGTEITLWIEGEGSETCRVPAPEADALVDRLEAARDAAIAAEEPAGRLDPRGRRRSAGALAELERSSAWDRARTAPPRSDLGLSIAVAVPVAIALGIGALLLRNAASDGIALSRAIAARDLDALACYASSGGAEAERVRREVLPRTAYASATAAGTAEALGRYVEAYPDGPDTAEARTRWIAMEHEAARASSWSLRAFLARFPDAPQAAEARAALPRLSLEEAIRSDEVDAYTYVIREHAGTPEAEQARAHRHARYERALAALVARGPRAETAAFLGRLFAWLEEHDGPEVLLRFRTPDAAALRRFDAAVQEISEMPIVPIAPSFSTRLSVQREALVFDRLHRAFGELVPRDVLPIARGRQLPHPLTDAELEERLAGMTAEEAIAERARLDRAIEDDTGQPEIRIDYTIVPTGNVYVSDSLPVDLLIAGGGDRRAFAGFRIAYAIELRIPEDAARHRLEIEVEPPASFSVDGGDGSPTGGTVYETMATHAFDRLGERLTAAFLGAGGEAAPVP